MPKMIYVVIDNTTGYAVNSYESHEEARIDYPNVSQYGIDNVPYHPVEVPQNAN